MKERKTLKNDEKDASNDIVEVKQKVQLLNGFVYLGYETGRTVETLFFVDRYVGSIEVPMIQVAYIQQLKRVEE